MSRLNALVFLAAWCNLAVAREDARGNITVKALEVISDDMTLEDEMGLDFSRAVNVGASGDDKGVAVLCKAAASLGQSKCVAQYPTKGVPKCVIGSFLISTGDLVPFLRIGTICQYEEGAWWHWGKEDCRLVKKDGTDRTYAMTCEMCIGKACFHWVTFYILTFLVVVGCCCCCCFGCCLAMCKMAKPAQPSVSNTVELPARV